MPWPDRVFTGKYPVADGKPGERAGIPQEYEAELQGPAPYPIKGTYIDLFADNLPTVSDPVIQPGGRRLLVALSKLAAPSIAAASCRITGQSVAGRTLTFQCDGIDQTECHLRTLLPSAAKSVLVDGQEVAFQSDDQHLLSTHFPNTPAPGRGHVVTTRTWDQDFPSRASRWNSRRTPPAWSPPGRPS